MTYVSGAKITAAVECLQSNKSIQADYTRFKVDNAIKRVFDPVSDLYWTYYEVQKVNRSTKETMGREGFPTVVLLHGICGTAGCYFYLMSKLADAGIKCISAQYPEYYSPDEWIAGFMHFIEYLKLTKPMVFASDLGGFLLQLFVESYPESICAMALCNSYRRTDTFSNSPEFRGAYGKLYTMLPHVLLRTIYVDYYIYPPISKESHERVSVSEQMAKEFMANELDQLTAGELGSRISLQMTTDYVAAYGSKRMQHNRILIIETTNNHIPEDLNDDMRVAYYGCKVATMKSGGDFPYLSKPDEVVSFILVHLTNVHRLLNEKESSEETVNIQQSVISCGVTRELDEGSVRRSASASSVGSMINGHYSYEYGDYVSPSLSDA